MIRSNTLNCCNLPYSCTEVGKTNLTGSANRKGPEAPVPNESIPVGADNPTWVQSLEASFNENTLTGKLLNPFGWDDVHNNRDKTYNVEADLANLRSMQGVTLGAEQEAFLRKSVSKEDWTSRVQEWTRHTEAMRTASANTSAALVGGLLDPTDALLGAGLGKLAGMARLGVAARAGVGFGAGYVASTAPESTNTTADNIWNAVGPMIGTMIPVSKEFRATADARAAERAAKNLPADMALEDAAGIREDMLPPKTMQNPVPSIGQAMAGGIKKFQSFVE